MNLIECEGDRYEFEFGWDMLRIADLRANHRELTNLKNVNVRKLYFSNIALIFTKLLFLCVDILCVCCLIVVLTCLAELIAALHVTVCCIVCLL